MKNKKFIGLTAISAVLVSAIFGSSMALANCSGNCELGKCNSSCHCDRDKCDHDKSCRCDRDKCKCDRDKCDCDHDKDPVIRHCGVGDSCGCDDDVWGNPAFSSEFRQIAESGDYNSWRYAAWRYGFLSNFQSVNERNFPRFIQAMRLLDCGDIAGARVILKKLDCEQRAYNRGYEDGFKDGFVVGYNTGYGDAIHDTRCNDGVGRCDMYGIRY